MVTTGAYFAVISLKFLKTVTSGATILLVPANPLFTFTVISGNAKLSQALKSRGYIKSYNGPIGTAILGMLFFIAAQMMIVMMFKKVEYLF